MLFNSANFLIFFPMVVALYFAIAPRFRWILLLIASYYFYMCWKPEYLILILVSTAIDYYCGIKMGAEPEKKRRRKYLFASLASNLGILFGFKYLNFFGESAGAMFDVLGLGVNLPYFNILLPVGISFYTFQTLSYSIDVYLGKQEAEKHFGIFAVYVSFFPQLVAGPIERSTHLMPQFHRTNHFNYDHVTEGVRRMIWGFFKKVVIADRLSFYVNEVYNYPDLYAGGTVILATVFFAFQIYCDFSGYSDIAIGAAKVMGYDLMENFRQPYFSRSIREFWGRWHISLSTWFRDYLYIPLGGNRVAKWRWYYNLFIVFVISGLWHGANWTFIVWGALHGFYLVFAIISEPAREKLHLKLGLAGGNLLKSLKLLTTFVLVLLAWVFFRANNIGDAFQLLGSMADIHFADFNLLVPQFSKAQMIISVVAIGIMEWVHLIERQQSLSSWLKSKSVWLSRGFYAFLVIVIALFGEFGSQDFIYFQF